MTEAEWLACTEARPMFKFLQGRASDSKLRLYATAICRRYWDYLPNDECRRTVEIAEQYADGVATADELLAARDRVLDWYDLIGQQDFEGVGVARLVADTARVPLTGLPPGPPALIRDVFGNPFRPVNIDPNWRSTMVVAITYRIYEYRDFYQLPMLAAALQDAGCDYAEILDHCRSQAEHVRGCWVIDAILGKE